MLAVSISLFYYWFASWPIAPDVGTISNPMETVDHARNGKVTIGRARGHKKPFGHRQRPIGTRDATHSLRDAP